MTTLTADHPRVLRPFENAIVIAMAALLLFTMGSETLFKPNIVPSEDWLSLSAWVAYPLSLMAALLAIRVAVAPASRTERKVRSVRVREALSLVMFIPACALSVLVFVQSSLPHWAVWMSGSGVAVDMTVGDVLRNKGAQFCATGVIVEGRPYFADQICDVAPDVLQGLRPGDQITVTGTGNWMGVIPSGISLAQ